MTHEELQGLLNDETLYPHPNPNGGYYQTWLKLREFHDHVAQLMQIILQYKVTDQKYDDYIAKFKDALIKELQDIS